MTPSEHSFSDSPPSAEPSPKLDLVFCMRHSGYLRLYESFLHSALSRGHRIHLVIRRFDRLFDESVLLDRAPTLPPGLTWEVLDETKLEPNPLLLRLIRSCQDYIRYLAPRYRQAHSLRARAAARLPGVARTLCRTLGCTEATRWALIRILRMLDHLVGAPPHLIDWLEKRKPDAFVISPVIDFGGTQLPWLKACRATGTPSILAVASWDNLTNKGLAQIEPDGVVVWNRFQEEEARELHRMRRARIRTTGAQVFDPWFEMQPSTDADGFARRVGLRPERPYLLYLCSSPFIAPEEVPFVCQWIDAVRGSGLPGADEIGLLIRPHPQHAAQWDEFDEAQYDNVAVHPRGGATPIHTATRNDFFDSLFHARAVVGINTSAMIEAGILDKPVFTIQDEQFADSQNGTLHYRYLADGGLLTVANDLPEHVGQLADTLVGDDPRAESRREFVREFVRPHGWDTPAAKVLTTAIEELTAELRAHPRRAGLGERIAGGLGRLLGAIGRVPGMSRVGLLIALPLVTLFRIIAYRGNTRRLLHLLRWGHKSSSGDAPDPLLSGDLIRAPQKKIGALIKEGGRSRAIGIASVPLLGVSYLLTILYGTLLAIADLPAVFGYPFLLAATRYRRQPKKLLLLLLFGWSNRNGNEDALESIRNPFDLLQAMEDQGFRTAPISEAMETIRASNRPIVIGPWMGEVGFELLYWIPFVTWAMRVAEVEPSRIRIASRGGTEEWYQAMGGEYEDLLHHHSVADFRGFHERRIREIGHQKQSRVTPADREALAPLLETWNIEEYDLFHPALMYRCFGKFWFGSMPLKALSLLCDFRSFRHTQPEWSVVSSLPERYIAMKFYFSESFPDKAETRAFVHDVLETVARNNKIVLLNTELELDDHVELSEGVPDNVLMVPGEMLSHNNLDVQSQIVAGATAFLGTYGGFSYLAPFYGVPSFAFHANESGFVPAHLDAAHHAFRHLEAGNFSGNERSKVIDPPEAHFSVFDIRQWPSFADLFGRGSVSPNSARGILRDAVATKPR